MKRTKLLFWLFAVIMVLLFVADVLVGDSSLSPSRVWTVITGNETDRIVVDVVLSIRLVRVVVAMLVGAALSVGGLQMQTVFRNPLADPYLLGISSGASLGVALMILGLPLLHLAPGSVFQSIGIAGAGWVGAAFILVCVGIVSRYVKNILGVLIIGVMFGYIAGSIIQILQYLSSAEQMKMFFLWSMGALSNVTVDKLFVMMPVIVAGLLIAVISIKSLNLLLLGEDYAQSMGLDIKKSRILIFTSVALLAGTVTAFCGPVGFIGLAVPHVARMIYGNSDHRILLPGSMLVGINAMLICDIVSKIFVLPVNCITALLGVPVVIWVVCKNLRLV